MIGNWTMRGVLAALAATLVFAPAAEGSVSTYVTPTGATDTVGDPVSATATFTTGAGILTVTVQNLLTLEKDVGQAISDLGFTFTTGQTTGTISSTPNETARTVNSDKTFSDASTNTIHWALENNVSGGLRLCDLCVGGQPKSTIIGSSDPSDPTHYSNANSSIAGNDPHNPFLAGVVTFNLNIPGLTAASVVNSVFFSFGTAEGNNVTGVPGRVPAASALLLLGSGLGIVGIARLRRRRR